MAKTVDRAEIERSLRLAAEIVDAALPPLAYDDTGEIARDRIEQRKIALKAVLGTVMDYDVE